MSVLFLFFLSTYRIFNWRIKHITRKNKTICLNSSFFSFHLYQCCGKVSLLFNSCSLYPLKSIKRMWKSVGVLASHQLNEAFLTISSDSNRGHCFGSTMKTDHLQARMKFYPPRKPEFYLRYTIRRQAMWLTCMLPPGLAKAHFLSACLKSRSLSVACSMTYERRVVAQIWLPSTPQPRLFAYLHVNICVIILFFFFSSSPFLFSVCEERKESLLDVRRKLDSHSVLNRIFFPPFLLRTILLHTQI